MSVERVREYFDKIGADAKIIIFEASSATVELAAQALGVEGARIAKSISLLKSDGPILVIAAGDAKIDNKKYKAEFGEKAKMIRFDEVEEYIGYAPGGVCPFGVKEGVKVYLDMSLKRFETVYPAAGDAHSAVELTLEKLEKYSNFEKWVDVCSQAQRA